MISLRRFSLLSWSRCFVRFFAFSARLSNLLRELKSLSFKEFQSLWILFFWSFLKSYELFMRCVSVVSASRVVNMFIITLNLFFIFFFNRLKRWFFCWIEVNSSRSIFKTSTYATKLFTLCDWFYLVALYFCATIKRRFCEFFIKSIKKFKKFFHFHVFCMIFRFFSFLLFQRCDDVSRMNCWIQLILIHFEKKYEKLISKALRALRVQSLNFLKLLS